MSSQLIFMPGNTATAAMATVTQQPQAQQQQQQEVTPTSSSSNQSDSDQVWAEFVFLYRSLVVCIFSVSVCNHC